jgi:hypothetical protein
MASAAFLKMNTIELDSCIKGLCAIDSLQRRHVHFGTDFTCPVLFSLEFQMLIYVCLLH